MNALAGYLYGQLRAKGWGVDDLASRSGLSRATILSLLDPAEERSMLPDCITVEAVATALEVDRTEVVLAAAEACGLAIARADRPEPTLRTATNAQLIRELRRRLATGAKAGTLPRPQTSGQVTPLARLG
jgi:lambda repressor-like predicted transcriptional regulator